MNRNERARPVPARKFHVAVPVGTCDEIRPHLRRIPRVDDEEIAVLIEPIEEYVIVTAAGIDREPGLAALERLASGDTDSRSAEHEGRRLIRVDGGYIVLNYDKYREKDYTNAIRQRRYREKSNAVTSRSNAVTSRVVTHAEAEAEAERKKMGEKVMTLAIKKRTIVLSMARSRPRG